MRKTVRCLNLLGVLLVFSIPAWAQTKYRFEVFGAASFPRNKDFQFIPPQSTFSGSGGTHEFSLGGRGGVRFGADGRGHWGQDFIYSYGSNPSKIVMNPTPPSNTSPNFAFTNRSHQVSYNALWYPCGLDSKKMVFPYLTAGAGATFVSLSQKAITQDAFFSNLGLKNETVFAFNAGGGVRLRLNDVYGFRIDVRDYMSRPLRYGMPKASSDPLAIVFPVSGVFHQPEVSFAFVYYFK